MISTYMSATNVGNRVEVIRCCDAYTKLPPGAARHAHGWAIRAEGFGEGALYSVYGSYAPFPPDAETRAASGDPRPSTAERYPDRAAWVEALARACDTLVAERLLLREEADELLRAAAESWSVWNVI